MATYSIAFAGKGIISHKSLIWELLGTITILEMWAQQCCVIITRLPCHKPQTVGFPHETVSQLDSSAD